MEDEENRVAAHLVDNNNKTFFACEKPNNKKCMPSKHCRKEAAKNNTTICIFVSVLLLSLLQSVSKFNIYFHRKEFRRKKRPAISQQNSSLVFLLL